MNRLVRKLAWKWQVDRLSSGDPDVIVCIGFTIRQSGKLTTCAESIMKGALALAKIYPQAKVAYGVFAHSGNTGAEKALKESILREGNISKERIIYLGEVSSTFTEAEGAKKIFESLDFFPRNIAIVTGAGHSRTCRFVWQTLFPKASVGVEGFPIWEEVDPDDPMVLLRNEWAWFLSNVARHIVFRTIYGIFGLPGLKKLRWIRQPTKLKTA